MKAIGTAVTVIALANLLGLGGLVGWLVMTDRLDADRAREIREKLGETIPAERAREQREAQEAEAEATADDAQPDGAGLGSAEALAVRLQSSEADQERIARMRREVEDLRSTLRRERGLLDAEREKFEAERRQFEQMRAAVAETEGAAQFKKSLGVLESVDPEQAAGMLNRIIDGGDRAQAVVYLNAMQARARTAIMEAFIEAGQEGLATELLEALRVQGLEPLDAGDGADGGAGTG